MTECTPAEARCWDLAGPLLARPGVERSTMMGLPCLRIHGAFFACCDRRTGDLLVKLPEARVDELIAAGRGHAFAPAGRRFREWAAVPPERWRALEAAARRGPCLRGPGRLMASPRFAFPTGSLEFLADLGAHNTRTWIDANRDRYETAYPRHNALYVHAELSPAVATDTELVPTVLRHWRAVAPLHTWLTTHVR